jgi:hypothetical protein
MAEIRRIVGKGLFAIAWVGSLALALVDIGFLRSIVFAIFARAHGGYYPAVFTGQVVTIIGAVLFMAYMTISGEYYLKHWGESKSWTYLGRTYIVLLLIPVLEYFM